MESGAQYAIFQTRANAFQNYMDYEDIYNRFEAVGQNVNVRNGRARVARSWCRYTVNLDLSQYCLQILKENGLA